MARRLALERMGAFTPSVDSLPPLWAVADAAAIADPAAHARFCTLVTSRRNIADKKKSSSSSSSNNSGSSSGSGAASADTNAAAAAANAAVAAATSAASAGGSSERRAAREARETHMLLTQHIAALTRSGYYPTYLDAAATMSLPVPAAAAAAAASAAARQPPVAVPSATGPGAGVSATAVLPLAHLLELRGLALLMSLKDQVDAARRERETRRSLLNKVLPRFDLATAIGISSPVISVPAPAAAPPATAAAAAAGTGAAACATTTLAAPLPTNVAPAVTAAGATVGALPLLPAPTSVTNTSGDAAENSAAAAAGMVSPGALSMASATASPAVPNRSLAANGAVYTGPGSAAAVTTTTSPGTSAASAASSAALLAAATASAPGSASASPQPASGLQYPASPLLPGTTARAAQALSAVAAQSAAAGASTAVAVGSARPRARALPDGAGAPLALRFSDPEFDDFAAGLDVAAPRERTPFSIQALVSNVSMLRRLVDPVFVAVAIGRTIVQWHRPWFTLSTLVFLLHLAAQDKLSYLPALAVLLLLSLLLAHRQAPWFLELVLAPWAERDPTGPAHVRRERVLRAVVIATQATCKCPRHDAVAAARAARKLAKSNEAAAAATAAAAAAKAAAKAEKAAAKAVARAAARAAAKAAAGGVSGSESDGAASASDSESDGDDGSDRQSDAGDGDGGDDGYDADTATGTLRQRQRQQKRRQSHSISVSRNGNDDSRNAAASAVAAAAAATAAAPPSLSMSLDAPAPRPAPASLSVAVPSSTAAQSAASPSFGSSPAANPSGVRGGIERAMDAVRDKKRKFLSRFANIRNSIANHNNALISAATANANALTASYTDAAGVDVVTGASLSAAAARSTVTGVGALVLPEDSQRFGRGKRKGDARNGSAGQNKAADSDDDDDDDDIFVDFDDCDDNSDDDGDAGSLHSDSALPRVPVPLLAAARAGAALPFSASVWGSPHQLTCPMHPLSLLGAAHRERTQAAVVAYAQTVLSPEAAREARAGRKTFRAAFALASRSRELIEKLRSYKALVTDAKSKLEGIQNEVEKKNLKIAKFHALLRWHTPTTSMKFCRILTVVFLVLWFVPFRVIFPVIVLYVFTLRFQSDSSALDRLLDEIDLIEEPNTFVLVDPADLVGKK